MNTLKRRWLKLEHFVRLNHQWLWVGLFVFFFFVFPFLVNEKIDFAAISAHVP